MMAFRYFKLVDPKDPGRPRGLWMFQREGNRLDEIAWSWLRRRWEENPEPAARYFFRGDPFSVEITRAEAEAIAASLGIGPVPSEEEMMRLVDANELIRQALRRDDLPEEERWDPPRPPSG
jgi:hypothetical protein